MLKDLQSSLSKHHIAVAPGNTDQTQLIREIDGFPSDGLKSSTNIGVQREHTREIRDTDAACNIVGRIFQSIDLCLKEDKSKVKLSLFTKSFIKGILTNAVRNGIDDFIKNMNDQEIRFLLDDIQRELDKRK